MSGYEDFSAVYDDLMTTVDYADGAARLLQLFEKYDRRPTLLLDLACGTGGFSFPLANAGIEVIGVDASESMLAVAEGKKQNAQNPLFLCQPAQALDLFGTVDGAICMLDSLNHLTEYRDFSAALQKTALFLEPGRLFIFDLNTTYKHRKILNCNTFVQESETAFCVWQNEREGNTVQVLLDIFAENQNGSYTRLCEDFSERAYTQREVAKALQKAGLQALDILDEDGGAPRKDSARVIYITRKI